MQVEDNIKIKRDKLLAFCKDYMEMNRSYIEKHGDPSSEVDEVNIPPSAFLGRFNESGKLILAELPTPQMGNEEQKNATSKALLAAANVLGADAIILVSDAHLWHLSPEKIKAAGRAEKEVMEEWWKNPDVQWRQQWADRRDGLMISCSSSACNFMMQLSYKKTPSGFEFDEIKVSHEGEDIRGMSGRFCYNVETSPPMAQ